MNAEDYLAQFQIDPEEQRRRQWAALSMGLGSGLLSGRDWGEGIGRGAQLGLAGAMGVPGQMEAGVKSQFDRMKIAREMADKDAEAERATQLRGKLAQAFKPTDLARMGPGGPTQANAQRITVADIEKYRAAAQAFAAQGMDEAAKRMDDIADRMQETFNTTPQVEMKEGPDGRRVARYVQFGNRGGTMRHDIEPEPKGKLVSTQDRQFMADERTGMPFGQAWQTGMTPYERAQAATAAQNARTSADRLAWEKQQPTEGGKPPQGYRYKADGGLEPIPGGPADTSAKDAQRRDMMMTGANTVLAKVDEALDMTGFWETGATGYLMSKLPGSDAYDLRAAVDTIKSRIGQDTLNQMREISPTGTSGYGQLAIYELQMLQAAIGSLDANQSEDKLRGNLMRVKKHYENWKRTVMQAQGQQGAAPVQASQAPQPLPGGKRDYSTMSDEELQRALRGQP